MCTHVRVQTLARCKVPLYRRRFTTADNNNQENRRGKGSFVRATRPLPRSSILKMSSHPATASCYYTIVCESSVFVRGTREKKGDDRTYVRAHVGRHNCERCSDERRRVTRVGSRRSFSGLSLRDMHLCNRLLYCCATYAIVNTSASLRALRAALVKRFNTLCLLEGFARMSYPPRGDESGYWCNFLRSYEGPSGVSLV